MPPFIVSIQPDGQWPPLDLRRIKDPQKRRLSVVMLGAGFSKAANAKSPTWKELVNDVGLRMNIQISGVDPRADAITLSWRGSRRPSTAVETAFQQAVRDALLDSAAAAMDSGVLASVAEAVRNTECDAIIDLNYDRVAETMLTAAGIPYYRVVGAQMDVRPPLPEGMIVLWKIHGSIDYPATIVLSPTEYQRKYEVNDLGTELVRLGSETRAVWSFGVGLQDDDVWTFLTLNASDLEIVALHMGESPAADLAETLQPWEQVLGDGVAKITVLAAPLSDTSTGTLRHCVTELNKQFKRPRKTGDHSVKADAADFDGRFEIARVHAFLPAMRVIVEQFAERHEKLVHYLLTRSHDNSGHRWLPFLTSGDIAIDDDLRSKVAQELLRILIGAREFVEKFAPDWPSSGLLVGAAAQSAVRYVFELFDAFAIDYTLVLDRATNVVIQRDDSILVGANPFDSDVRVARSDTFNPMQLFTPKKQLRLYYPLVAVSQKAPPTALLLKENEWEAMVMSMFYASRPRLELAGEEFDLGWTWPVFPWGFGRRGLAAYRASSEGTVTKSWHLVAERLSGGRQICKGGSLRDRGETIFMIARRGSIKIGEYDDFVQRSA
jgi:SIR2-like domain